MIFAKKFITNKGNKIFMRLISFYGNLIKVRDRDRHVERVENVYINNDDKEMLKTCEAV